MIYRKEFYRFLLNPRNSPEQFGFDNFLIADSFDSKGFVDFLESNGQTFSLGFLNQHGYLLSNDDPRAAGFRELDLLLRDGIGMELACNLFKSSAGCNLNGTDLIPKIVTAAIDSELNWKFFVFGTCSPYLECGAKVLIKDQEVVTHHGFDTFDRYLQILKDAGDQPNFIILAMGMPRQEILAEMIRNSIPGTNFVVCGGAIIDFCANRYPRAPSWIRTIGFEWLFRLIMEPRRLFNRYVIGIPRFFMKLLKIRVLGGS